MDSEFIDKLKEAQEIGARWQASSQRTSRAHSLAVTHLETAQLWAEQDQKEKNYAAGFEEDDEPQG